MLIFDAPYVSDVIADYAETSKIPVLDNAFARTVAKNFALNLMDEQPFAEAVASGKRLYTVSENALDWVYAHVGHTPMAASIRLMKDKFAFRSALTPMHPNYFFRKASVLELRNIDISTIEMPFILKPCVGFYSVGVYVIASEHDWRTALDDIDANLRIWKESYPGTVLDDADFLLESRINGQEYAVDVYFNDQGNAVIVNILKHEFSSGKDVSDRLYYTSKGVIQENLKPFTDYFTAMNQYLGAKNFPAHIEIRVADDGTIIPIECNPMRFSGWCTTDLAFYALGIKTYQYYLENRTPDWSNLLAEAEGVYSMVILDKPAGLAKTTHFDYEAVSADFHKILHLRRMEKPEYPMFGIVFAQTPENKRGELDRIMLSDLTKYCRAGSTYSEDSTVS